MQEPNAPKPRSHHLIHSFPIVATNINMTSSGSGFGSGSNNTFHIFPHLPWELRARMWELTISGRTIYIYPRLLSNEKNHLHSRVYGGSI
ncbi:hypothetical protein B0H65DRAFT_552443 [Neurospora tetraspora]|uniref:2EXR domain-containing protein n=1 Tax=Neurospora tetraspora TaxID=94610 RepID=A0AAE0J6P9_9PEZI|nr:hypothetical protein B0H65DRAFT_552443 [Neurospora tetraspora]